MAADELRGGHGHDRHQRGAGAAGIKDLVCGMIVDPHTAKRREYGGRTISARRAAGKSWPSRCAT